jgi:hypothetical protein
MGYRNELHKKAGWKQRNQFNGFKKRFMLHITHTEHLHVAKHYSEHSTEYHIKF